MKKKNLATICQFRPYAFIFMINMSIKNPSSVLHIYPTCLVDATYVSTWYPTSCRLPNLIQVPCLIWLRYKWVFHQGGLYLLMSSFGPVWKMTSPSISLLAFHSILVTWFLIVFGCLWQRNYQNIVIVCLLFYWARQDR